MVNYAWPGNVRELENCIERLVIMSRRRLILPEDLLLPVDGEADRGSGALARLTAAQKSDAAKPTTIPVPHLRDTERQQILRALAEAEGVQVKAAILLGITPRQLAYRLRRHQIVRSFQTTP